MHALALALALAAAEGAPPPPPAAAPVPVTDPVRPPPAPAPPTLVPVDPGAAPAPPVAAPRSATPAAVATPGVATPPAPTSAPPAATPMPDGATPDAGMPAAATPAAATPAPAMPAALAPHSAPARPAAPAPPPPLPQAAVEKLGQGDRAFLERDYRSALFAYQDAVYLAPTNPRARVKLGRAYLALRYPVQAITQAELALAAEPGNVEARRLLEEAKSPAPRPPPAANSAGGSHPASTPAEPAVAARSQRQPRVFRFEPEAEDPRTPVMATPASAPSTSALPTGAGEAAPPPGAKTVAALKTEGVPGPAAAAVPARSATQRYRDGVTLLGERSYERAEAALSEAIDLDPRLAVAHAARGSARVGLGRHRDAADDYRAALALDPGLATPLYGLAECHRVLGDGRAAADMYERYAQSRAGDAREELRAIAAKRAQELRR